MNVIERVGSSAIVQSGTVAYTYEASESPRDFDRYKTVSNDNLNWSSQHNFIGDYVVYPYGSNNDLPEQIKEVVQNNNLAPGILTKKTQLLWGSGPALYRDTTVDGKRQRVWEEDEAILNWLESWDFEDYLLRLCVDYQHMQGVYSRIIQSRGTRVGNNFIARLEHIPTDKARLASLKAAQSKAATHIVTTDWSFATPDALSEYRAYNIFDFTRPFKHKNAILYSNMYSFCTDYYTVPDLYGSMEWLRRSTAVPLIFKALSKNGINLKYHIVSPQQYWDDKAEALRSECVKKGQEYKESMLEEYKDGVLKTISKVLSGEENTGKFLHTSKTIKIEGATLSEHGWEVKVVDQKIKDYVESQIKIADRADVAVTSGIGLHGSLGNIAVNGKADSGSEQLYALKNFMATGIDIPEMIITKAINYAIKANFPTTRLKIGFYHMVPEKEQDVNPKDRMKNN
ncbi:MAG: hypothetical protein BM557_01320 [Flavobacterium sp. MedPE-SWcel]|uniref:hypothetical protein n=1 Tax=uncultured Flavobacterium sp. TaxID=165435 RepID=UPI0009180A6D|nr:hypothetical protein [uncultured Flavobacterium sp.]OIQ22046.1 MAG: hypothetical protein BM557_01320 [Flavobacterium sp. MedPE-SWcel]